MKIIAFILMFCFLVVPCGCTQVPDVVYVNPGLEGPSWRPAVIASIVQETDRSKARELMADLSYTASDADPLLAISLALEPQEATKFLKKYISNYSSKNDTLDMGWGRAVFCLGLVQTDDAQKYLIKLWEKYDKRFIKGRLQQKQWMALPLWPLGPIGDSLHFYLAQEDVRKWYLKKISEIDQIVPLAGEGVSPMYRHNWRVLLLNDLYRWDIIESVDGENAVAPKKIVRWYLILPAEVNNISRSAQMVVYWAEKLESIGDDISGEEWRKMRNSPFEQELDRVAERLGINLSIALWKDHLRKSDGDTDLKRRLWHLGLNCYLSTVRKNDILIPELKDNVFLLQATNYFLNMPEGFSRKIGFDQLFTITYYVPYNIENIHIDKIRELCEKEVPEDRRREITTHIEQGRTIGP